MPCNAPLVAWKSKETTARGKRAVTFNLDEAYLDLPLNIPCRQCYGCRLDQARQWAFRCQHESQLYEKNSFVTLTYNDKHLPKFLCWNDMKTAPPTLHTRDFVLFMKSLRKKKECHLHQKCDHGLIRFFQAGEYGDLGRPHHHALLFNCHFEDKTPWRKSGEYTIYRSTQLEKLWTKGHSEIGTVTFQSAAYIARYTLNKNQKTAQGRIPEYMTMSRRPGIGKTWLQKYMSDVYPSDEVITPSGKPSRPPRYYDEQLSLTDNKLLQQVKAKRIAQLTPQQRLSLRKEAREAILRAQARLRSRTL